MAAVTVASEGAATYVDPAGSTVLDHAGVAQVVPNTKPGRVTLSVTDIAADQDTYTVTPWNQGIPDVRFVTTSAGQVTPSAAVASGVLTITFTTSAVNQAGYLIIDPPEQVPQ